MSEPGLPQSIVLDVSCFCRQRGSQYTRFGFRCLNAYNSNPAKIAINVSADGKRFSSWAILTKIDLRSGMQMFNVTAKPVEQCKYVEIVILETFGANRTYLGQVFLEMQEPAPTAYQSMPSSVGQTLRTSRYVSTTISKQTSQKDLRRPYHRSPSDHRRLEEPQYYSQPHRSESSIDDTPSIQSRETIEVNDQ